MNYKVLYRKYRPKTFADFVGQEHTIKTLKNAIIGEKISHAYLFTGPRGTGKTSAAKVFSKTINCENPIDANPCNRCKICINIEGNADIIEIDAASNNGVDEVREIINNVRLTPSYSKYKVYIIDEVHMLSGSAFNALLLTLEEPPPHVIFILATTEIQNVPITVLSRCQRYDFKRLTIVQLKKQIKTIANKEKVKIHDDAVEELAYVAEGGMRDALSMLDQLIDSNEKEINLDDVINSFGTIATKSIQTLINYIEKNNTVEIIDYITKISESSVIFKIFVEKLVKELKNKAINIKMGTEKSRFTYNEVKNLIIELNECQVISKTNVNSFGLVQLIILGYVDSDATNTHIENGSINQKKEPNKKETEKVVEKRIEENLNIENDTQKQKGDSPITKPTKKKDLIALDFIQIRTNNCFVNAKKEFLNETKEKWQKFLKEIKTSDKKVFALVAESDIVAASDSHAILINDQESTTGLLNNSINEIEEIFNNIFKTDYKFVALYQNIWVKEKQKYIEKTKNGHKYKILEEKPRKNSSEEKGNQTEILAKDIFGDKLEIK